MLPILEPERSRAGSDFHPRLLARAGRPGPHRPHDADRPEGRRRHRRRSRGRGRGALRRRGRLASTASRRPRWPRLQDPGEHLPRGQHRAGQRAEGALRPHGDRRLGGDRRGHDEAVRVPGASSPGPGSAATASRSTRSTSPGWRASTASPRGSSSWPARSTRTMPYYCRSRVSQALNHGAQQVARGIARPRPRRGVQGRHLRHARVAGREADRAAARARAPRSPTTTPTSPSFADRRDRDRLGSASSRPPTTPS